MNSDRTGIEETVECAECGSPFVRGSSKMSSLCPECAHLLYGYENCPHQFVGGRCTKCGWDGSSSEYLRRQGTS